MVYISDKAIEQNEYTAITLGKFDGLHLGHQKLINMMKDKALAENLKTVAFSFFPSPAAVLYDTKILNIYSQKERLDLFKETGIDVFIEYPFNREFANLSPENFVSDILFGKMKCKLLIVGEDYQFGKDKAGGLSLLKAVSEKLGIELIIASHVKYGNEKISSGRIRSLILENKFKQASDMLNRPYYIKGTVCEGRKIGRTIGFPTVNINIEPEKLTPVAGVYITDTVYKNKIYKSVTNIGYNPTVSEEEKEKRGINLNETERRFSGIKKCETHVFDFNKNIYGEEIMVIIKKFLRGEKKFGSINELRTQIEYDISKAGIYDDRV